MEHDGAVALRRDEAARQQEEVVLPAAAAGSAEEAPRDGRRRHRSHSHTHQRDAAFELFSLSLSLSSGFLGEEMRARRRGAAGGSALAARLRSARRGADTATREAGPCVRLSPRGRTTIPVPVRLI